MSKDLRNGGFAPLNLGERLLAVLNQAEIVTPTPIQEAAIPVGLQGRDLVGIAQTGTGKTLAFLLPIAQRINSGEARRALILAPTRELAQQIADVANTTISKLGLKTSVLIGGASMSRQVAELRNRPAIVVATPGRLLDHMQSRTIRLDEMDIVVLDEGDRMLDMGFLPAIEKILSAAPRQRQTMLFSATMPTEIARLAQKFMDHPERIEVSRSGSAAHSVAQELVLTSQLDKSAHLDRYLHAHRGSILVFARTRHGARKVAKSIRAMGHAAAEIHSDRTMAQRKAALDGFKEGTYRVLVATDIASRGIDVKNISLVINYDLPDSPEDYIHRIGRTGRAGETGRAVSLATPDQAKSLKQIERLLGKPIARAIEKPGEGRPVEPRLADAEPRSAAPRAEETLRPRPPHRRPRQPGFHGPARGGSSSNRPVKVRR
jgi:ATP-dependent RNA helicase RhlE